LQEAPRNAVITAVLAAGRQRPQDIVKRTTWRRDYTYTTNQEGTVPVVRYVGDIFVTHDTPYKTAHQFPEAQNTRHNRIKCKTKFEIKSKLQLLSTDTQTGTQTHAGWYSV
jgi:hypothetical protein